SRRGTEVGARRNEDRDGSGGEHAALVVVIAFGAPRRDESEVSRVELNAPVQIGDAQQRHHALESRHHPPLRGPRLSFYSSRRRRGGRLRGVMGWLEAVGRSSSSP